MQSYNFRRLGITGIILFIAVLVIVSFFCNEIAAIFSLLSNAVLVIYAMYEYSLKNKEQLEYLDTQYQAKRLYKFRQALISLNQLLKRVNILSNKESITILSEELAYSLLRNSSVENTSKLIIELLKPENADLLETTVCLVRERNSTVKLLNNYRNNIYSILNNIFELFPVYSLLLSTLFDLLLFYKQHKISENRLLRLLSSGALQREISNSLCETSTKVSLYLQVTSIIAQYINNTPSADLKIRRVIVTEEMSTVLSELLDMIIDAYLYLNNEQLQLISNNQRLEDTSKVSYIFVEACAAFFNKVMKDLNPQEAEDIFNVYNTLIKMVIDGHKTY